jgi:HD-GYP domain-containing protein (c-di-GMP phosphodiesterase class II)
MRLVVTTRVPPGARLARDVFRGRPNEVPLLRAGIPVDGRHREALLRAGIRAVYVEDELSAGIEVREPVSHETRHQATSVIARALDDSEQALSTGRRLPVERIAELRQVVLMIVQDVAESDGTALALSDLASADAYTLQHSIDVAVLGVLLGRRLFRERGWIDHRGQRTSEGIESRLVRLGLGLVLHDIGKLTFPPDLLVKSTPLDEAELSVIRRHPLAGLELLRGATVSPLVKAVVRSHHERWDGGGYPDGRGGERIHQFARIASVADVYDAITSERPYGPAQPPTPGSERSSLGRAPRSTPTSSRSFAAWCRPSPPARRSPCPTAAAGW